MKITINVTKENILFGVKSDECQCAVALALVDAGFTNPSVGNTYINFETERNVMQCALPIHVTQFIEAFDEGENVKPFTFEADAEWICEREAA